MNIKFEINDRPASVEDIPDIKLIFLIDELNKEMKRRTEAKLAEKPPVYDYLYAPIFAKFRAEPHSRVFTVRNVWMGQSTTTVELCEIEQSVGSAELDFFSDKDGKNEINIYNDRRFNPYL